MSMCECLASSLFLRKAECRMCILIQFAALSDRRVVNAHADIFLYRPRALYNIDRRVYQDRILWVIITCAGVRADEFCQSDFHLEPRKQCAKMEFSGGQDTYKKSENAIRWSIKCLCYWLHNVANKHLPNTTVLHWKKHAIIVIVYMYIKGGSRNNFGKAYLENKKN